MKGLFKENYFENVIYKMSTTLFKPQCVEEQKPWSHAKFDS